MYLAGKNYNQQLSPNYYETVNTNLDFFAGNQWRNSESTVLQKPVFNIIKRITTFMVASLMSSKVAIQFEPLANMDSEEDEHKRGADIAFGEVQNFMEKTNMTNRFRDGLFQAAIKGDVAMHFYFDPDKKPYRGNLSEDVKGEICTELVSGTNVFFGNANNIDVDMQPYIIISGRDMVDNLKAEAKVYKQNAGASSDIQSDMNYQDEPGEGGQIEVQADNYGKATYIIKYWKDKKTGTIKASKSVQNAYIYQNIDTGLEVYPIAWLPWEKQENQYHGRAFITGVIPNQIFINKMFAMVMYNLMMTAFPKAIYNADVISSWSNEIGTAIGVSGFGPETNIRNMAGYLEPGNMSQQIVQTIELAMNYTKETLGITDAAMGDINPRNTSAIVAVQKATVVPLENVRANMYEWVEDIARILLDMMGTYYGLRPVVRSQEEMDPMTGQMKEMKKVEMFDFSAFKTLWLNTKVDVGEGSYWSEIATMQTLDNLLMNKMIDVTDYLERVPDTYIPEKHELIRTIKARMEQQAAAAEQQAMAEQQAAMMAQPPTPQPEQPQDDPTAQYEQMAQFVESLPQEVQDELRRLPDAQYEQAVMDLMEQQQSQ